MSPTPISNSVQNSTQDEQVSENLKGKNSRLKIDNRDGKPRAQKITERNDGWDQNKLKIFSAGK